jgi:hypothetical protein
MEKGVVAKDVCVGWLSASRLGGLLDGLDFFNLFILTSLNPVNPDPDVIYTE